MSNKRAVWRNRIDAWQNSGVSAAACCRSRSLEYSQFVYWQRVLRDETRSLVPVVVESAGMAPALMLELALPNGKRPAAPHSPF